MPYPILTFLLCFLPMTCFGQGWGSLWEDALVLEDTFGRYTAAEVAELDESLFVLNRTFKKSISLRWTTYVKFRAPEGGAFLYFRANPDQAELYLNGKGIGICGTDVKRRLLNYPKDSRVLRVPPGGGVMMLRLASYVQRFKYKHSVSARIELFRHEAELNNAILEYKNGRSSYDRGQMTFLGVVAFLFLLVLIPYFVLKEKSFGAYLFYVSTVFVFYLLRRSYLIDSEVLYVTASTKYTFEPLCIPVIIYAYVVFIGAFLEPLNETEDKRLIQLLRYIRQGSWLVFLLTVLLLLFFDLYWANTFGVITRLFVALAAIPLTVMVARRPGRLSNIISLGVAALTFGMVMIIINDLRHYVDMNASDLELHYLSNFQVGFLAELVIYWFGLWIRLYDKRELKDLSLSKLATTRSRLALLELQLEQQVGEEDIIILKTAQKKYKWARAQVQRFVAEREVTRIYFDDGRERLLPLGIGEVERQLSNDFLRVHRSHIISLSSVESYQGGRKQQLLLEGGVIVPVGRVYLERVRKAFA